MAKKVAKKCQKIDVQKVKTTKFKIKDCSVNLQRLNLKDARYRAAVFKWYNIQEVSVKLNRIEQQTPESTLKSTIEKTPARSHVPWLPTVASTLPNSASAYSALGNHQTVEKPEEPSMEEFLTELKAKYNKLKPEGERPRLAEEPAEVPQWKQIYNQFQAQKEAKKRMSKAKKN